MALFSDIKDGIENQPGFPSVPLGSESLTDNLLVYKNVPRPDHPSKCIKIMDIQSEYQDEPGPAPETMLDNSNSDSSCTVASSTSAPEIQSPFAHVAISKLNENDWESLCPEIMNAETAKETYWCLATFDDICTHIMLDSLYLTFSTRKMTFHHPTFSLLGNLPHSIRHNPHALPVPGPLLASIVLACGSGKISSATAVHSIVACIPWLRNWLENEISIPFACHFLGHLHRYVLMYHGDAGYDIAECERFQPLDVHQTQGSLYRQSHTASNADQKHAMLVATRPLLKGEKLTCCSGQLAALSIDELEIVGQHGQDFSVLEVNKVGRPCLLAGPLRFANHDCNPNAMFYYHKREGATRTVLKILRPVACGVELLVNYGARYFGDLNEDCRCATCQVHCEGAFRPTKDLDSNAGTFDTQDALINGVEVSRKNRGVLASRAAKKRRTKTCDPTNSLPVSIRHTVQDTNMSASVMRRFFSRTGQSHITGNGLAMPWWMWPVPVVCSLCSCSIYTYGIDEHGHVQCDMCARHALIWGQMWPQRYSSDMDPDVLHGPVDASVEWIQYAQEKPYLLHALEKKLIKPITPLLPCSAQFQDESRLPEGDMTDANQVPELVIRSFQLQLDALRRIPPTFATFKYMYEDGQTSTDHTGQGLRYLHVTNYNQRNLVLARDDDRWWPAITVPVSDWDVKDQALWHDSNYRIQYIGSGDTYSCLPHKDLILVTEVVLHDPLLVTKTIPEKRIILLSGTVSLALTRSQAHKLQKLCGARLPRSSWPKWHAEHKLLHSDIPNSVPRTSLQSVVSRNSCLYYQPVANLDLVSIFKGSPSTPNPVPYVADPTHSPHTIPSNVIVELPPSLENVRKSKKKKKMSSRSFVS